MPRIVSVTACAASIVAIGYSCSRERPGTLTTDTVRLTVADSVFERDSLRIMLRVPRKAQSGRAVQLAVTIRNQARRQVEIRYGAPPQFFLSTPEGRAIWDSFDGAAMSSSLSVRRLSPGDSLQFNQTSSLLRNGKALPAGHYDLWVRLPAFTRSGTTIVGPRPLTIQPDSSHA